jgi:hypothetical protein
MSSDSTPADTKRLPGFGGIEIDQNPVAFPPWVNSPPMEPRGSRSIIPRLLVNDRRYGSKQSLFLALLGERCPLLPRKRTFAVSSSMSALCHKRTFPYANVMSAEGQIRIAGRPVAFAYAFATFFRSGLPLIPSRASRSSRSLAVSRRVACSLASYAEAACTPSCFHRNKRSARSFFIEVIGGMIDNALLRISKHTTPSSTEPGAAAYNAQVITSGGHEGMPGLGLRYR